MRGKRGRDGEGKKEGDEGRRIEEDKLGKHGGQTGGERGEKGIRREKV